MHMEDGEENVGVGGEDHQQNSDDIHTSKHGKDAWGPKELDMTE